jgi:hypoxanthine phosphoribosyltransferase
MPKDITHRFPGFEKFITFGIYYPVNSGISDNLSESVLNFKRGDENTIQKWAVYVKSLIINSNHLNLSGTGLNLVRALGHNQLRSSTDDSLGRFEKLLGKNSVSNFLSKTRTTESLKSLGRNQRKDELNDVFLFSRTNDSNTNNRALNFIIFDDVVTTGTTIKAIAAAIKKSFPNAKLFGFSLLGTYDSHSVTVSVNDRVFNRIFNQTVNPSYDNEDELLDSDETMDAYMEYSRGDDYSEEEDNDEDDDLPF